MQMGDSEEGLRAETKRLEVKLAKGDTMRAEQHARIVQLEAIVASVKVRWKPLSVIANFGTPSTGQPRCSPARTTNCSD